MSTLARHLFSGVFPCNGVLRLSVEPDPFRNRSETLVTERCDGCGVILKVWGVLPEPRLVEGDGA